MFNFTAIVGQDDAKLALLVAAVDKGIGGVLLSGVKGTGKSTIVRGFASVLPDLDVVDGCCFNCISDDESNLCDECQARADRSAVKRKAEIVTIPLGTTQDRLLGSIDMEKAMKTGDIEFKPGLLARANNQVLYIDEVNLLPDHIADNILDASASGQATVQREGISVTHPAGFTLVGTMNPEEGQLRPQILDRFALSVRIKTIADREKRTEIIKRSLAYSRDRAGFNKVFDKADREIRNRVTEARKQLDSIRIAPSTIDAIAVAMAQLELDGQRADIVVIRAAIAFAALEGDHTVDRKHIQRVAPLAVCHRTRKGGMEDPPTEEDVLKALEDGFTAAGNRDGKSQAMILGDLSKTVLDSALRSIDNTELKKN